MATFLLIGSIFDGKKPPSRSSLKRTYIYVVSCNSIRYLVPITRARPNQTKTVSPDPNKYMKSFIPIYARYFLLIFHLLQSMSTPGLLIPSHVHPRRVYHNYRSKPSNSTKCLTVPITGSSLKSRAGFSILRANTSSSMDRSRLTSTPTRAQPRSRSQPSTTRPRPRVSREMGPEKRRSV